MGIEHEIFKKEKKKTPELDLGKWAEMEWGMWGSENRGAKA